MTIKSLDPGVLEFRGDSRQDVRVGAKGQSEVRFEAIAKTVGRARVSMSVRLNSEADAFEDTIPVEILSSKETVAAYGEASTATATEKITVPEGVVPGVGGLHVELSSTAMVGLGEGARYLVEYPYGCAEQRSSRTLALLLAADLGDAFALPGIDPKKLRPAVQTSLVELEKFQCPSGAFAYWPGGCSGDLSYLTSYVLHVMQSAKTLKYERDDGRDVARGELPRRVARPASSDERSLDAVLHRLEGVRGQGARRRRKAAGQPCQPPVRVPRPDAGLRARALVRRDCVEERVRSQARRAAAPDDERHPPRRRERARRGAGRSVSLLAVELERAIDGDRARFARAPRRRRAAHPKRRPLDDERARERPVGQHAGERVGHAGARELLPPVRVGDPRLHRAA